MIGQLRTVLEFTPIWLMGVGIFTLLWLAAFAGRHWGRKGKRQGTGDAGLVVSASLGLLALLLGFTVSMAVGRYDARRFALVAEANAADDFRQRLDLLPAGSRHTTLAELGRYLDARLRYSAVGQRKQGRATASTDAAAAVKKMWAQIVVDYRDADPSTRLLLVQGANQMFGAATARDAALSARLPETLILLLILFPISSMLLVGYVSGTSRGIYLTASTEMILLLTLTLLLIVDLDRPRSGTIIVNEATLRAVQAEVQASIAAAPVMPHSAPPTHAITTN